MDFSAASGGPGCFGMWVLYTFRICVIPHTSWFGVGVWDVDFCRIFIVPHKFWSDVGVWGIVFI